MNIKEYYSSMSKIYVVQVAVVGVFITICLTFLMNFGTTILLMGSIFIGVVVLLCFFIKYLYYVVKETKVVNDTTASSTTNQFLLLFQPAVSLHVKLFRSNGICEWEICDKPVQKRSAGIHDRKKSYTLSRRIGHQWTSFIVNNKGEINICDDTLNLDLKFVRKTSKYIVFKHENIHYSIYKKASVFEIFKDKQRLATIGKGMMPIMWQRYFPPNTPILETYEQIAESDLNIIFSFIIFLYANQKN